MGGASVVISNPSEGFCGQISGCLDEMAECGRGCLLIESGIKNLRQSDIQVFGGYRFEPGSDSDRGRTIFHLLLCI